MFLDIDDIREIIEQSKEWINFHEDNHDKYLCSLTVERVIYKIRLEAVLQNNELIYNELIGFHHYLENIERENNGAQVVC